MQKIDTLKSISIEKMDIDKTVTILQSALTKWYLEKDESALRTAISSVATSEKPVTAKRAPEVTLPKIFTELYQKNDEGEWKRVLTIISINNVESEEVNQARSLTCNQCRYLINNAGDYVKYVLAILILTEIFHRSRHAETLREIFTASYLGNALEILKEYRGYDTLRGYNERGSSSCPEVHILKIILAKLAIKSFPNVDKKKAARYSMNMALYLIDSVKDLDGIEMEEIIKELSDYDDGIFYLALWRQSDKLGAKLKIFVKSKMEVQLKSLVTEGKTDLLLDLISN